MAREPDVALLMAGGGWRVEEEGGGGKKIFDSRHLNGDVFLEKKTFLNGGLFLEKRILSILYGSHGITFTNVWCLGLSQLKRFPTPALQAHKDGG